MLFICSKIFFMNALVKISIQFSVVGVFTNLYDTIENVISEMVVPEFNVLCVFIGTIPLELESNPDFSG
jgi:hypothetical protein